MRPRDIREVQNALAMVGGYVLGIHRKELGELYGELLERLKEDTEAGCTMEWLEETLERLNYAKHRETISALNYLFESVRGG